LTDRQKRKESWATPPIRKMQRHDIFLQARSRAFDFSRSRDAILSEVIAQWPTSIGFHMSVDMLMLRAAREYDAPTPGSDMRSEGKSAGAVQFCYP
jgi:hypothetical protein